MTQSIQILRPEVADQIAAGEVVERPASIIKEAVENSLDAGANRISIRLENGGKTLIEITDNGHGMNQKDLAKAPLRHATSKISNINDLFGIHSFGFRGEALAAIGSVARLTIQSFSKEAESGFEIQVHGGEVSETKPCVMNHGTVLKVEDLFYTIPARLQYLSKDTAEFQHILKMLRPFIFANPSVKFTVEHQGKIVKIPEGSTVKERFTSLSGSHDLVSVDFPFSYGTISGFISTAGAGKPTKKHQYLWVNQRAIQDHQLAFAIREAYVQSAGIEKHLHPEFVLFIEMDPIMVDINVHPRKAEVRFAEKPEMFQFVKRACMEALEANRTQSVFPNQVSFPEPKANFPKPSGPSFSSSAPSKISFKGSSLPRQSFSEIAQQHVPAPHISHEEIIFEPLKLMGQSDNKYILAENNQGIWVFDQHALHERQRFEMFWNQYQEASITWQKLLVPQPLEDHAVLFKEYQEVLKKCGIDIDFSLETPEVTALSTLFEKQDLQTLLEKCAQHLEADLINENPHDALMRILLEYKACRGSVMFGDTLEWAEMEKLISDFHTTKWRDLCPHGRPNHWLITKQDLLKQFHRS